MSDRGTAPCRSRWSGVFVFITVAYCLFPLGSARADAVPGLTLFEAGQLAEATRSWRLAADEGDATAALYLGVLYDTGLGVSRDAAQALFWYKRAASNGSVPAMFNVGVLYDAGLDGTPDPAAAAAWYQRAAAQGFGRAEYNLALLYESGTGVQLNRRRAALLFRAAASHGIAAASAHLVRLGMRYTGVVRGSDDPAMLQFREAEAILLRRGTSEAAQAIPILERAAQQGNAMAEYDLGYFNEHGIGAPVNTEAALKWYKRTAKHSDDPELRSMAEAAEHTLNALATRQASDGRY